MSILCVSIILLVLFATSMLYEPRNVWNAPFLLVTIGFWVLAGCMQPGIMGAIVGIGLMLSPLIFLGIAVFFIINGVIMLKREGKRLQNSLSMLVGILMLAGAVFTIAGLFYFQKVSVARSLFALLVCLEFYVAFTYVALLIYALLYTCLPKRVNCDYIIVHGCGLAGGERVTPLLKGRVDKAVAVYQKSKNHPKLVVSGGQGADEKISEAQAMKNYLLETGFPKEDIIMEDQSKTTFENLKNVKNMLDVDGKKNHYIFVTNNYHVFRTGLFAKKLKMKASGVGCHTAVYYWPSAFIREYIAIMWKYKWIMGIVVLLWALVEYVLHF